MKLQISLIKLINITAHIILLLILTSCTHSTKPKTAIVTGKLILEDLESYQGVSAFLFRASVVDSTLSNIKKEYPSIGFELSDWNLFDHRDHTPSYSATSGIDGVFRFENVLQNKYILVLIKEGYGPIYRYDVEINQSSIDLTPMSQIVLYKAISVPATISNSFIFESGKSYFLEEDATFLPESNVVFKGNSSLYLAPGRSITFHGILNFESSTLTPCRISSSDKINETNCNPLQFSKMEISSLARVAIIKCLIVNYANNGLDVKTSAAEISSCVFRNNNTACRVSNAQNVSITNCYFANSRGVYGEGLTMHNTSGISVENTAFRHIEKVSLDCTACTGVVVNNCMFKEGEVQIYSRYSSEVSVSHCSLLDAKYNIRNTGKSNLTIQYCDFSGIYCINTHHTEGNTINNGWTKANLSNFSCSSLAVQALGYFYNYQFEYIPLDFRNNYWGVTTANAIDALIEDFNDFPPREAPGEIWPKVEYLPFRTSRVPNAGVQ